MGGKLGTSGVRKRKTAAGARAVSGVFCTACKGTTTEEAGTSVGSGSGTGQQRRHGRRTVATEEEAWMVTADGEVEDGDGMGGTSALVGCKEANQ
jgi:hypothetical protein